MNLKYFCFEKYGIPQRCPAKGRGNQMYDYAVCVCVCVFGFFFLFPSFFCDWLEWKIVFICIQIQGRPERRF